MSNSKERMTKEEAVAGLRKPLPVDDNIGEPSLNAYLDRLDELFGQEWEQEVQATASGVRCEITIAHLGGFYVKRSAIADNTDEAFKLCCHMIGLGRTQNSRS